MSRPPSFATTLRRWSAIWAWGASAAWVTGAPAPEYTPDERVHRETIVPFLAEHCGKCHGPEKQKGEFRVDRDLPNNFLTRAFAERWSEVLDQLNSGAMPPKGEPRPPVTDATRVADWITHERLRGEKARRGGETVIRRLNRAEYNNTMRDLTGVDMQPADDFPADPAAAGFDNNAGALSLTPLQLELYIKAAVRVLDRAIVTDSSRPPSIKWRFQIEEGFQEAVTASRDRHPHYVTIDGRRMSMSPGCTSQRDHMTVFRRPHWDSCGVAHIGGVKLPRSGSYVVRVCAAATVPTNEQVLPVAIEKSKKRQAEHVKQATDPEQRRQLQDYYDKTGLANTTGHFSSRHYFYGPPRMKVTHQQGGLDRILQEFDVTAPQAQPGTYELKAWLEATNDAATFSFSNVYRIPPYHANASLQGDEDFPRPELLLDWVELEGPVDDSWPPLSHRMILIDSPNRGKDETAYARDVLQHFMRRAYRRPLKQGEVDGKLKLFVESRARHSTFEEAIKIPMVAMLSSPQFLFLGEPGSAQDEAKTRPLSPSELATRLSYFLSSSMPDDELARLAEKGQLSSPKNLKAQADRLLAGDRSEQLAKNFAGQWLKLRDLGKNPPSRMIYLEYDHHLETSMRGESEAFFSHILRHDLDVSNFIRSDFVTINERMARFYGIPGVKGDHFRVVKVPEGMMRGGVLTQGSVLSVTSNGTRTSPVWRGVWILERILGNPPPPPPPNAGEIPPKVPGMDKATVRERLKIHREQPQCAHCHNKIDPLGFALENFDASGQWREHETTARTSDEVNFNDPGIDARAQLPGGAEFAGVRGLQTELLKREDQFLRCLAEKLYTYALGREPGYADEPSIQGAVQHMKQNGKTLRSLIHHIVTSEAFRSK